jgi:hypothetical protein
MLRLVIAFFAGWMIAFGSLPSAAACTCLERPFEELAADADAIFEARVARIEPDGTFQRVHLDVVQTWRGANREHIEVRTPTLSSACGVSFELERSYLVLASEVEGALTVSLCGGTRLMDMANDERLSLGSGVIPVDIVDDSTSESERARTPQTLAPRGGGCAGCAVTERRAPPLVWLVALLAFISMRRCRNR